MILSSNPKVTITAVCENAILLTWPEIICQKQHQQITLCGQLIYEYLANVLVDLVPSYNSLMIYYKFEQIPLKEINHKLEKIITLLANSKQKITTPQDKKIEIPVYYSEESGWDLLALSQQLNLTPEQIIDHHSQPNYHAYALGFTPGFCYLGSLVQKLQIARKNTPRTKVPAGAVAIADQQTAVYPQSSPGGWHIIGQTPITMYSTQRESNNKSSFKPLICVGNQVKFTAIDKATFEHLGGKLQYEYS